MGIDRVDVFMFQQMVRRVWKAELGDMEKSIRPACINAPTFGCLRPRPFFTPSSAGASTSPSSTGNTVAAVSQSPNGELPLLTLTSTPIC